MAVATRRATSADVAREAGLSRATVGYVLNNVPHQTIPEATRQRVIAAAEKLGYRPSAAARSLRSGRSDLVLCLLPDWPVGPSVTGLMGELSAVLARTGLTLVVHQRSAADRPLGELWKTISPAAILVLDALDPADRAALAETGLTVSLAVRGGANDPRMLEVTDERVGRLQVEHLAAVGRRRLGYAFPADERVATFARPRLRGVQQACSELGLDAPTVATAAMAADSLSQAVSVWVRAEVDGLCAYNDELAIALLAALHRAGRVVPDDVAVIGVDDIPLAVVADPPLTTVATDLEQLAEHLAAIVTADVRDASGEVPPVGSDSLRLVVRASA